MSAELELDECSERFDMSTSSEQQILSYTPYIEVKKTPLVAFERA